MKMLKRLTAIVLTCASLAAHAVDMLVPSYFYPTSTTTGPWIKLAEAATRIRMVAILNPNSGPGTQTDPNYAAVAGNLRAAGGKVIGYVSSSYTTRRLADVTADINRYISMYQVDGFFIDEMTNDSNAAHIQYYLDLYKYIKGLNWAFVVVGNPGTNVPEDYAKLPLADTFVVFESNATEFRSYAPAGWMHRYPASRFSYLVYGASRAQVLDFVVRAKNEGIGYAYITSDALPNPWDTLAPRYWSDEVNALDSTK